MFNIFRKNKVVDFKTFLKKQHPILYNTITSRLGGNYKAEQEALFASVEYYIMSLKNKGQNVGLEDIEFLNIESED